jgi:hypothetical protein
MWVRFAYNTSLGIIGIATLCFAAVVFIGPAEV